MQCKKIHVPKILQQELILQQQHKLGIFIGMFKKKLYAVRYLLPGTLIFHYYVKISDFQQNPITIPTKRLTNS